MKQLFVSADLALKLQEAGFDEPCIAYYPKDKANEGAFLALNFCMSNDLHKHRTVCNSFEGKFLLPAPLYQQVVDFFREKKNLDIIILGDNYEELLKIDCYYGEVCATVWKEADTKTYIRQYKSENYKSYYDALSHTISAAIKIINP